MRSLMIVALLLGCGSGALFAQDSLNVRRIWQGASSNCGSIKVSGGLAFMSEAQVFGLRIFDISFPNAPTQIGGIDLPGFETGITMRGNELFVTDAGGGLFIVDVSDPSSPVLTGHVDTPGSSYGVAVSGNYAYIADGIAGLRIIDISNTASPIEVGYLETWFAWGGIAVNNGFAYIADSDSGLRIVNIENPESPIEVATVRAGDIKEVIVLGAQALIGSSEGLSIVNVSDPASPFLVGQLEMFPGPLAIAFDRDHAICACTGAGIRVIDLSDVANPSQVGYYDTEGNSRDIEQVGELAFLADLSYFGIYDCSEAMHISRHVTPLVSSSALHSAYPNPFNPVTTLVYDLAQEGPMTLAVYNLVGQRVVTLVEGVQAAGRHSVEFDAMGLPSGAYWCRMDARNYQGVQKVVLVR